MAFTATGLGLACAAFGFGTGFLLAALVPAVFLFTAFVVLVFGATVLLAAGRLVTAGALRLAERVRPRVGAAFFAPGLGLVAAMLRFFPVTDRLRAAGLPARAGFRLAIEGLLLTRP
jgi:hypothetical protein